jgi:hypothetical protein
MGTDVNVGDGIADHDNRPRDQIYTDFVNFMTIFRYALGGRGRLRGTEGKIDIIKFMNKR